jgi:hypothetical protein
MMETLCPHLNPTQEMTRRFHVNTTWRWMRVMRILRTALALAER